MNYEQKYKEALERARVYHMGGSISAHIAEVIFPELAESEDERIRQELIEHIKANYEADYVLFKKFSPDDVIAWLEKQGERRSLDADKVIKWLVANICGNEYYVKLFKQDFGL